MIYIATVHFETSKWIDIQLKYIKQYITQEYKIFAFLSGDAIMHKNKFDFALCEPIIPHARKLNILANAICLVGNPDDIIIFLDGDAFPIAPIDEFIKENLALYPLVAIKRIEHLGDCQPHPSFCVTTVRFWKEIDGDWKAGYEWTLNDGSKFTDVGGNLLKQLIDLNIEWKPIYRSHSLSDNKVLFGVYGGIIYHHCAGFREPITLLDRMEPTQKFIKGHYLLTSISNKILKYVHMKNRFRIQYRFGIKRRIIEYNTSIGEKIFNSLNDFNSFQNLVEKNNIG